MTATAQTAGVHHVGLTLPDIRVTAAFFIDVLGFREVGAKPDYPAVFISDGSVMLTLWQAKEPEQARSFDRAHNVWLHHLALSVADGVTLAALHDWLRAVDGVEVEFSPEPMGKTGLHHLMCYVPGGVRLELVAHGGQ